MITHRLTSQLDRDLKNKQNNSLPFSAISPLKLPSIDSNLSNMPKSFKKTPKPLSLVIYLLKTPTMELKQSNGTNFFDRKQSLSLISNDVLKICRDR